MLIYKDEYDTKELRNALRTLERAIRRVNDLGFVPYCGGSSSMVNIHSRDDWTYRDFTNENMVASLDDVLAEGGDY